MTKYEMKRRSGRAAFVRAHLMFIEKGYVLHHTSLARGYYLTDEVTVSNYEGKFGEGFVLEYHADNGGCHFISYYILNEKGVV